MNRLRPALVPFLLLVSAGCESSGGKAAEAQQPAYRDVFDVDRRKLVPDGRSPFFDLTPGRKLVLREDDEVVTLTVLDETRVVDGVTTRVLEEREEKNGALVEVSRNFFALDPATLDVYYFGEEVDIYAKGEIAGHGGAWMSGVGGARFGLLVPGKPRVGDRYYQELAPGIAMDRGEVVSIDATVKTPAWTFEHCLHVRESSAIEKGTGDKWYAPGVGLVKDEDCALISCFPALGVGIGY